MISLYNQYNFEALFKQFLLAENLSSISVRNYLSDLRYFVQWSLITGSIASLQSTFTHKKILDYLNFLEYSHIPSKTIKRRLSTLRRFGAFCLSQRWIQANPLRDITALQQSKIQTEQIVEDFLKERPELSGNLKEFLVIINSL
ncbi:site-specific integrase [Candidatus Roizmanbacteria bacterium]|nr:site-specific integrase [Candidatus Roizmanbacteria bacterium]